jgi:hypothetical protein
MKAQKFDVFKTVTFLANLCNSITVEMYSDIIRVSHGFDGCQKLWYIAVTCTLPLKSGNDDITNF